MLVYLLTWQDVLLQVLYLPKFITSVAILKSTNKGYTDKQRSILIRVQALQGCIWLDKGLRYN